MPPKSQQKVQVCVIIVCSVVHNSTHNSKLYSLQLQQQRYIDYSSSAPQSSSNVRTLLYLCSIYFSLCTGEFQCYMVLPLLGILLGTTAALTQMQ